MTEALVWCTECDWEEEVESERIEVAVRAKSAKHVSESDCEFGSTRFEVSDV